LPRLEYVYFTASTLTWWHRDLPRLEYVYFTASTLTWWHRDLDAIVLFFIIVHQRHTTTKPTSTNSHYKVLLVFRPLRPSDLDATKLEYRKLSPGNLEEVGQLEHF
jgi:hypothetical protein